MLQGTGSSVGKSLLVAGLCRAYANRGLTVRPFKPQNMSNNAAVTPCGGEIGRAQALQARAARTPPSVHMNPVLLKPQSETGAQIVVQGRVAATARARDYQRLKPTLLPKILDSFAHLAAEADLILVEGAGSASEINLRQNDIANMGFARAANTPVLIIGDIDRGGVIASLVGTHTVLDPADAALVRGFIVNRMRGDPTLFADGMSFIAARTGWPALGLIPHFPAAATLPAEDAADLEPTQGRKQGRGGTLHIAVPLLPMIANFDDLDPLAHEPGVTLTLVRPPSPSPNLRPRPPPRLQKHHRRPRHLPRRRLAHRPRRPRPPRRPHPRPLRRLPNARPHHRRPRRHRRPPGTANGLALLDVATTLTPNKRLTPTTARFPDGPTLTGYEMHMGHTEGPDTARPFLHPPEGATSPDGRVAGTYIHGLFTDDPARAWWLARLGAPPSTHRHDATVEATLDALATHLETHLDLDHLLHLAEPA